MTPWTAAGQASLSITNSQSLLKLVCLELAMPSNHFIPCRPLFLPPSVFPSIRVFSNESVLCIRWPKCWSFSFSNSPSNEYSGLISFRMYLLDFLAVQGTLKSLFQHHSSKASILQHSAFFIVQLSHLHVTTRKAIVLTRETFVGKAMPLLFNMLSRLVITFLPRSKHLLISWLQSETLGLSLGGPLGVLLERPVEISLSYAEGSKAHGVYRTGLTACSSLTSVHVSHPDSSVARINCRAALSSCLDADELTTAQSHKCSTFLMGLTLHLREKSAGTKSSLQS